MIFFSLFFDLLFNLLVNFYLSIYKNNISFQIIIFILKYGIMGIGDWGLGMGPNPRSPIPKPQYPTSNTQ